jgi:outer membrane protein assembly factor BamB
MAERTTQQMELELDTFWNDLVTGIASTRPESPDMEMAERLTSMQAAAEPRAGFLDDLWTRMLESERAETSIPEHSHLAAPVAPPIVPLPARPETRSRTGYRHWGKLAAALAALLAIVAVSAILVADRRSDGGPLPAAQRWTMTGGDPGKTNGNPDAPALADPTVQWRAETDGRIEGVPVVSDGVVFIGNQEHHLFAFDAESGMQLWDVNLRKPIAGTAAVGDGIVVIGTSTSLFGLDAKTGATIWQRDDLIAVSDPTIVDGAIFLVDDGNRLQSLDLGTGEHRWTSDAFAGIPAFAIDERSGRVFVTTPDGTLRALATGDGAQRWATEPGLGPLGNPLVADDVVVVPIADGVALFDGATGAVGLKNVVGFGSFPMGIPVLALADDLLIASTAQMVLAYARDSLDVEWSNQQLVGLTGEMTVGANSIYLPGNDRTLTVLDRETGEVQWTLPLDEVAQSAPAVTSGQLFVTTRAGSVYAIGSEGPSILNAPQAEMDPGTADSARPLWKSSGGPNALKNPTGIAVSPSGEVWVCDTANDRLQIFDGAGNFLREFGSHGSGPGQFDFGEETAQMEGNAPPGNACSLAFDAFGALYVADAGNFRVQRFPASAFGWLANACCSIELAGTSYSFPASAAQPDLIVGTEGTEDGQFLFPSNVAVAPNGDIYVGDGRRLNVQRFDASGNLLETIGKPTVSANGDQLIVENALESGSFVTIDGIAVDDQGRLYVADDSTQEIDRLELDGSWTTIQLTREDYRISGIAVDEFGNVFVAQINMIGGCFSIYDPNGALLGRVGSYGTELGQFDSSTGVALDGLGHVYATDWALNRLQKFEIDYEQLEMNAAESSQ